MDLKKTLGEARKEKNLWSTIQNVQSEAGKICLLLIAVFWFTLPPTFSLFI